ncbi:MAG: hydrogenase expression/formation protein HypE [Bacteroidetes bacterium]|nr:hydrogenase expression/formation protein HypE [Bacteroidota bacterium]
MPKLDFDVITLGHGSGGLLTNKLLDTGVFHLFSNEELDKRHDGAVLGLKGRVAFSTDSFVVSPIFFPGGDIGDLAVNGTVNDVAMCGGVPEYISVGFILEEGLLMEDFWEVLVSIKHACQKAGVQVVTGDTKVVERGKGDKVFVNTTGIGHMHPGARIGTEFIEAGDKILVSGEIAAHGMAIMSVREGLEFETTIQSDTANLNKEIMNLLDDFGNDIHLFRDPTRGGVASTLNEISRDAQLGMILEEKSIPVDNQVRAACEILGLDPLYVANEGVFIAIVKSDVADACIERLSSMPNGKNAGIIGEVTAVNPGKVVLKNAIGGKRVVSMLVGEQLPRIC